MKYVRGSRHRAFGIAAGCLIALAWPSTTHLGVEAPQALELPALWLVPSSPATTPHTSALARAVADVSEGRAARALPALTRAADSHALGGYALLHLGRAQLALKDVAAARGTANRLLTLRGEGYLPHAARWFAAEVAEAAAEWPRAAALFADLAASDEVQRVPALWHWGLSAVEAGDRQAAIDAFTRLHYDYPVSAFGNDAGEELEKLGVPLVPATPADAARLLARAQALFDARRFSDARAAFSRLQTAAEVDRSLVALRLGQCDYHLNRHRAARDQLRPLVSQYIDAEFYYFSTLRALGLHTEYIERARAFVDGHPDHPLARETLNDLATHFIVTGHDDKAADVFLEALRRFPTGLHADRSAWKAGWWKYRTGAYAEAVRIFEAASAAMPDDDTRPAWLYWAGRSHQRLGDRPRAIEALATVVADYRHSYYGRQALRILTSIEPGFSPPPATAAGIASAIAPGDAPPNAAIIRDLLAAGLYADARLELRQAEIECGRSPLLDATLAYTLHQQGEWRAAIIRMREAYPQFRADGGEQIPTDIRKIIYPVGYWDLIVKHATALKLDPYLMAALIAQESTFQPDVRSSAGAWGLMQIMPATGRLVANRLKLRPYSTARLKQPEINIRIGMANFAALAAKYNGSVVPVLAGYNAGPTRATRWLAEKPGLEQDEFIDDIPFPETQNYVKRILGSVDDYRMLYGKPPVTAPAKNAASGTSAPKAARKK